MAFDKNVAAAPAGSIDATTGSSSGLELNLYEELIHFVELSPEEQRRLMAHPGAKAEARLESEEPVSVPTPASEKTFETETPVPVLEAVQSFDDSNAPLKMSEVRPETPEELTSSGPLSGLSFAPDLILTEAPSRSVCLTCGAESASDELFCVNCGGFVDEIASTPPVRITCGECGVGIETDEIFCPMCGAGLPS